MRTRVLLATATLIALSSLVEAQWNVKRSSETVVATTTGTEGQIHVSVGCQGNDQVVALTLRDSATFQDGDVEAQWSDGSTEQYAFQRQTETLVGSSASPRVGELIAKLRSQNTVRLRLTTAQDEQRTDWISLTGSSGAIGSLPCSPSNRASSSQPPRRTDAEIRQILVRQSTASYSGSCPCPYNSDRAGRSCGRRSAYSRPGGASPLCYPRDVSDAAVAAYRARTER